MARRRFFVPFVRAGRAELTGDEAHHLTRVLRVEEGHTYEISDNERAYLAEVETARKNLVAFRVTGELPPAPEQVRIHLLLALIKFDRLESALEKATELGVTRITLVETTRSERGLEKAADKRLERWRRILLEASQQSRRERLPEIELPVPFHTAIDTEATRRYFLDEQPGTVPLLAALPERKSVDDEIALLVGPEGGWTDSERAAATAHWQPVSVGPHILRAETAAMAGVALITNAWSRSTITP